MSQYTYLHGHLGEPSSGYLGNFCSPWLSQWPIVARLRGQAHEPARDANRAAQSEQTVATASGGAYAKRFINLMTATRAIRKESQ